MRTPHSHRAIGKRDGLSVVELLMCVAIIGVLSGVVMRCFVIGTRATVQQSAQSDVQSMGRIALERFVNDTRGGFAVVTHARHPRTGRVYRTTASSDNPSTLEDDRFTIVLAVPSVEAGGSILFDSQDRVAAYDAVIWRVVRFNRSSSDGIGWRATDIRWHLVRTAIPAVWLTDRAATQVDRSGNRLGLRDASGAMIFSVLGRLEVNTDDLAPANLRPATVDLMLDVPTAAPFVALRDSGGLVIGRSPSPVTASLPSENTGAPPADRSAFVTAMPLPQAADDGSPMPVTDVALMDVRLPLVRREAALVDGRQRTDLQMVSATDVKLRNKRDWN